MPVFNRPLYEVENAIFNSEGQIIINGGLTAFDDSPDNRLRYGVDAFTAAGGLIDPYVAPPPPVPESVTRRQMLIGLATAGFITTAEAIAAAQSGAVPAAVQAVFDALPTQADKDAAAITWAAMSVAERGNALVAALAAAQGLSSAQVDDLFRAWAIL